MIILEKLDLTLGGKQILNQVDLKVKEAERLAIVGLSGSGKSTLLKCICGLHQNFRGSIRVSGQVLNNTNLKFIRNTIGYVSQGNSLFPHLTVFENLNLATQNLEKSLEQDRSYLDFLFELTSLSTQFLTKYPRELSGGQSQRVEIIRALISKPKILLMDEPTSALDVLTKRKFQNDLKPILDQLKTTLILVTHDIKEANFFSKDIMVMDHGHVIQYGTLNQLREQPASDLIRELTW